MGLPVARAAPDYELLVQLCDDMVQASPAEFLLLRESLQAHKKARRIACGSMLCTKRSACQVPICRHLRVGTYDPTAEYWRQLAPDIVAAELLVQDSGRSLIG